MFSLRPALMLHLDGQNLSLTRQLGRKEKLENLLSASRAAKSIQPAHSYGAIMTRRSRRTTVRQGRIQLRFRKAAECEVEPTHSARKRLTSCRRARQKSGPRQKSKPMTYVSLSESPDWLEQARSRAPLRPSVATRRAHIRSYPVQRRWSPLYSLHQDLPGPNAATQLFLEVPRAICCFHRRQSRDCNVLRHDVVRARQQFGAL
jgi:hypothetical protein